MDDTEIKKIDGVFSPNLDIVEKGDAFMVWADVPGVMPDGIDISLEGDILTVHGGVKPPEVDGLTLLHQEYGIGDYETSLKISGKIDREKIEATVADGVLTLTLPKAEEIKPRQIEVKAA